MDPRRTAANFKKTSWTMVNRAATSPADLECLLAEYWSPVYAYLRRKGQSSDDAADLAQSFLARIATDPKLLEHADPQRGRFRSYLLRALNNFVIDEYRKDVRRPDRAATAFVPEDRDALTRAEPNEDDDPSTAFHRQWVRATLDRSLRAVELECRQTGMVRQWTAFDERVLRPALYGAEPARFDDLKTRLNVNDRQELYSMLQTVKRKLDRSLRAAVAETVHDRAEVERDLAALRDLMGG